MKRGVILIVCLVVLVSFVQAAPLQVHPTNSRYFTDGSGKAIYMTGSHSWWNIHKNPSYTEFEDFLDFVQSHGGNYVRLWTGFSYPNREPYPWNRPGPNLASDGKPKFDMDSMNQSYFDLVRERVLQVQSRGMYCSVMLFGSFNGFRQTADWKNKAWNPDNNINPELANAFDVDDGYSFFTTDSAALNIQKKLVRKFIDTLNDVDNFIFEVMNEPDYTPAAQAWHNEIINYAKSYESNKPKQHLIGLVGGWDNPQYNGYMMNSPGDWWSPQAGTYDGYDYRKGGPAAYDAKPVIVDSDHFDGGLYKPNAQEVMKGIRLVWETFTRGNHPILMDCYHYTWNDPAFGCTGVINHVFDPIRDAMGHTLNYADRFSDLALMIPSESICSTGYCLVNPGQEYLIFQPISGNLFTVNLITGDYDYEWFNPNSGTVGETGTMTASGGVQSFTDTFGSGGSAVLYLYKNNSCTSSWSCSDTNCGACANNQMTCTEVCVDTNSCLSDTSNPVIRSCSSTNSLVAHYKFDGDATDSAGNNHGTLAGNPTWTTGKINGALSFDGSGDYVDINSDENLLETQTSGTMCAWVYPNSVQTFKGIVGDRNSLDDRNWTQLWVGTSNFVYFGCKNNDAESTLTNGVAINSNSWHFICGAWDSSGIYKYIDGNLDESSTSKKCNFIKTNSYDFRIGRYYGTNDFNGTIDDVRIYNYALSASEVQNLYNQGTGSVCGSADTSGNGIIEIGELINYISQWKAGSVTIGNLIDAIGKWKSGC